jgi:6-pyruvoyl-tetrahydropterin synthase
MLQFLRSEVKTNIRKLKLETFIIGSYEDEKNNSKYVTSLSHNLLNPKFEEQNYVFKIYENLLSFIFIRITVEEELVGRCVVPLWILSEGYRSITIYDNYGREYDDSLLICYVRRE